MKSKGLDCEKMYINKKKQILTERLATLLTFQDDTGKFQ
jgi:hypothetical protein